MATKHEHRFTIGRSENVETCSCGKFRFTAKGLAENPPIVEVVAVKQATVADILAELPETATWAEMKAALRAYFGYGSLTDGRATDLVADYVYLSQFK